MKLYADLLREARELPEVVIGDKTYTGGFLSYEQFIEYEELLYYVNKSYGDGSPESNIESARQHLDIFEKFLRDVFPEPDQSTMWESIIHLFTRRLPKRWKDWDDPVVAIKGHQNVFQIFNELFTYQQGEAMEQANPTNGKQKQEKLDSSKVHDEEPSAEIQTNQVTAHK